MSLLFNGAEETGQTGLRHAGCGQRHKSDGLSAESGPHPLLFPGHLTDRHVFPHLSSLPVSEIALHLLVLLFIAAFVAGFIDSIAGGGGLIVVPALLLAGIPPLETLGTSKLGAMFGSGSATLAYARKGHIDLKEQFPLALISAMGAALGAALATLLPADALRIILPVLLIAIALYFGFKPNIGDIDRARRISHFAFAMTVVPLIGFYDGLFGPGTGSFFMLCFVTLAGFGILKATAHTKLLNFGSNIGAFIVFALFGAVMWKVGLVTGVAQFLGAQAGSRLAMKKGAAIIKPLLVITCIILAAKLLSDPAHPIRVWLQF